MLDPRGPRVNAAITLAVFAVVLVTGWGWLALAQAAVFAITAVNPKAGPYGLLFRATVRPRLKPPTELEPAAPFRFAQTLGFVFATVAGVAFLIGSTALGLVAAAFGLAAAFLNAVFGLCLGCELYLAARRLAGRAVPARVPVPSD
ncbi:MAG TPA: DUF4395 domain-containing protein [Asanoa sp.]